MLMHHSHIAQRRVARRTIGKLLQKALHHVTCVHIRSQGNQRNRSGERRTRSYPSRLPSVPTHLTSLIVFLSLVITQLTLFIQTILATLRSNQSSHRILLPLLFDAKTTSALHTSTHTELGRAFRVLHLFVRLV